MSFTETDFENRTNDGLGDSVFTKMIKAGHRTYFIDVKTTRSEDYFMTITELRKKILPNGDTINERNKVFVFQEDIEKFTEGLSSVVEYMKQHTAK
jgi:hypothetical protein